MRSRCVYILCIAAVLLGALISCGDGTPDGFIAGETVTPERLEEISAQLFAATSTAEETSPFEKIDPEALAYEGTVYWVSGGGVWHTDRNCQHIRNAEELMEGSTREAVLAGKGGLCATCRKHMEAAATTSEAPTDTR